MVEITLPILLQIVQTAGILVGIVYYITIMRNTLRARLLQVSTQFSNLWTRNEFVSNWIDVAYKQDYTTYEEWEEKYGIDVNPDATTKIFALGNMFNSAGQMVKDGLVKPEFIWNIQAPFSIVMLWEKFKPLTDHWRALNNDPMIWASFEYLYNVTKSRFPEVRT